MRSIDWSRIKDLNFKQAWRILSSEISNKFFHDEMDVVPNIGDAAYYDLMVCFSKNKSGFVDKLAGAPAEYKLLGHFSDLAKTFISHDGGPVTDSSDFLYMCQHPSFEDIRPRDHSMIWEKNSKMIHIELNGLRKVVTNWTVESGSLVLDLELEELNGIKSVYIIGEVIYSERVFMEMKVSDGKLACEISNVPVAFSYIKFPVDKDGILQRAEQSKIKADIAFQLVEEEDNPFLEVKIHGMKTRSSDHI